MKYSQARAQFIENVRNKQLEDMKRRQNGEVDMGEDLLTKFILKENKMFKQKLHSKSESKDNTEDHGSVGDDDHSKNSRAISDTDTSVVIPQHPCSLASLSIADNELGTFYPYISCFDK